jgi:hypothetical protein
MEEKPTFGRYSGKAHLWKLEAHLCSQSDRKSPPLAEISLPLAVISPPKEKSPPLAVLPVLEAISPPLAPSLHHGSPPLEKKNCQRWKPTFGSIFAPSFNIFIPGSLYLFLFSISALIISLALLILWHHSKKMPSGFSILYIFFLPLVVLEVRRIKKPLYFILFIPLYDLICYTFLFAV